MKYISKKTRKRIERMKDPYEDPMERTEKRLRKRLTLLSTGGRVERSHKNVVGNVANKNTEERYNVAAKALKRIENEKKKRGLKEEWKETIKHNGETIEIFVNPSKKEMDEASIEVQGEKYLRFIAASKDEKLYVFDPSIYHFIVSDELFGKKKNINGKVPGHFWGSAVKKSGKWYFEGSDTGSLRVLKAMSPWITKYIELVNNNGKDLYRSIATGQIRRAKR